MSTRLALLVVIALCLFIPVEQGSAAVFLPLEEAAPVIAPGGFPVLARPARPFTFLDALSVSSIGESGYGLSGEGVPRSAASRAAAEDLSGSGPFSNGPRSYLFSFEKGDATLPFIGLGRVDRLDLTQASTISSNEYHAELMIGYKVTASDGILFGRSMQLDRPGDTSLRFQDEGWLLKFIKSF